MEKLLELSKEIDQNELYPLVIQKTKIKIKIV